MTIRPDGLGFNTPNLGYHLDEGTHIPLTHKLNVDKCFPRDTVEIELAQYITMMSFPSFTCIKVRTPCGNLSHQVSGYQVSQGPWLKLDSSSSI
jgi:hypothetical protein